MTSTFSVGVDLGGTKTEAVVLDPDGSTLVRERRPTPGEGPRRYQEILSFLTGFISEVSRTVPAERRHTVGIGIPGSINPETGLVHNANTTCLNGRPLKADLERALGRSVGMENDANCFTLAECRAGAGRGYGTVFGVIMGTGCGGGICVDGKVHHGRHGIAGEWGHYAVDPAGEPCYCGNRGCVETKISGSGLEAAFFRRTGRRIAAIEIVEGYRRKEPDCAGVFDQFLDDFGRCLGGLVSTLDPDAVVLGGGLSNIEELYTVGQQRVKDYAFHGGINTPILRHGLGDSAGVLGAAWIGR